MAVAAGTLLSCGLTVLGTVECFGDNTDSDTSACATDKGSVLGEFFKDVDTGEWHTCGTTFTGVVRCWGSGNGAGAAPAFKGALSGAFTSVSAGQESTCGVTSVGNVECWGISIRSMAPTSKTAQEGVFTRVSTGYRHACALTSMGVVECMGENSSGQAPTIKRASNGRFTDVSASGSYGSHTCGTTSLGTIECWGANGSDQAPASTSAENGLFKSVSCADSHTCGLTTTGVVECWGSNRWGKAPASLSASRGSFTSMSASRYLTCAVSNFGEIACTGTLSYSRRYEAMKAAHGKFISISVNLEYACALTDLGTAMCSGEEWSTAYPKGGFNLGALPGTFERGDGKSSRCPPGTIGSGPVGIAPYLQRGGENAICNGLCPAGRYGVAGDVLPECSNPCPKGFYCPAGTGTPIACPAGTHGVVESQRTSLCTGTCPFGHYCLEGTKEVTAHPCAKGRYGSTEGLTNEACSGICAPGTIAQPGSRTCTSCVAGSTYQPSSGMDSCLICSGCPPGKYELSACTTTSNTGCEACPAGKMASKGAPDLEGCEACGNGTFSAEGASFCSVVAAGFKSNAARTSQEQCPRNHYSTGNTDTCSPCQNGVSDPGALSCTPCEPGKYLLRASPGSASLMVDGEKFDYTLATFGAQEADLAGPLKLPLRKNPLGCESAAYNMSGGHWVGSFVLVRRGECTFVQKVLMAQQMGAIACVVYDNSNATKTLFRMGSTTNSETTKIRIPSVFISLASGVAMSSMIATRNIELSFPTTMLKEVAEVAPSQAGRCESCPAGFKCLNGVIQACDNAGEWAPPNASYCSTARAGHVPRHDRTGELPCPENTFSSGATNTCSDCVSGFSSPGSAACTVCPAGTRSDNDLNKCVDCEVGTFSETGATCEPCDAGFYADTKRATFCKTVGAGYKTVFTGSLRTGKEQCPEQTFSSRGADGCSPCKSGEYSQAGATFCYVCPKGEYKANDTSTRCEPCPKGRANPLPGQTKCERCPVDQISDKIGQTICKSCDLGRSTYGIVGSPSKDACYLCPPGGLCDANTVRTSVNRSTGTLLGTAEEWLRAGGNTSVQLQSYLDKSKLSAANELCRSGCSCIAIKQGMYRYPPLTCVSRPGDQSCRECPIVGYEACSQCPENTNMDNPCFEGACDADALDGCSAMYAGVMCSVCKRGFTRVGEWRCGACYSSVVVRLLIVLGLVAFILVVAYLIRSTIQSEGKPQKVNIMIMKISVNHLQIISMVALFPLRWPNAVSTMFKVSETASVSGEAAFSLDCELSYWDFPSPFYAQALLTALLPLAALALCTIFWVSLRAWRERSSSATPLSFDDVKIFVTVSSVVVLFLLHTMLTKTALKLFTCTKPFDSMNGEARFLAVDTRIQCWSASHYSWAFGLGGPMLIVYALGIPMGAFWILRGISANLDTNRKTFGFLYSSYEEHCWYWEVIIVLRKVAFAVSAVLLQPLGVDIQAIFGQLILMASLALQLQYKPYVSNSLDQIEAAGLIATFSTLSLGVLMFSPNCSEGARVFFTVVIVAINIAFVAFAVWSVFHARKAEVPDGSQNLNQSAWLAKVRSKLSFAPKQRHSGGVTNASSTSGAPHKDGVEMSVLSEGTVGVYVSEDEKERAFASARADADIIDTGERAASSKIEPRTNPMYEPSLAKNNPLPTGWESIESPGGKYFHHVSSGRTTWDRPVE